MYILKILLTGFIDELNVGTEGRGGVRDDAEVWAE